MAQPQVTLAATFGLHDRDLISLVGGGGKSTLLFAFGSELAGIGKNVVLTTTTKMGRFQIGATDRVCSSAAPECLRSAWAAGRPALLLTGGTEHKVTGPLPGEIDELFTRADVDYIVVEADGSHGMPLKAPAAYEPVIPATSTLVVILMGIDAVGQPLEDVVHRLAQAQHLSGLSAGHRMSPEDCAEILLHPEGLLRSCPGGARVAVAITKVTTPDRVATAARLADIVASRHPEIATVAIDAAQPR